MDKRTENVDQLFETLRQTPAMSIADLEEIVARREVLGRKRPLAIWGGVALVMVVAGAGLLMLQGEKKSMTAPIASKPVMSAVRGEVPVVRHAPPVELQEAVSSASTIPTASIQPSVRNRIDRSVMHRLHPGRHEPITPVKQIDGAILPTDTPDGQTQPVAFGGSKLIELTPEELAAIGVRVTEDGGVESNYQFFKGPTLSTDSSIRQVIRGVVTDSTYEHIWFSPINEELKLTYPRFSPSHVTDLQGRRREFRWRGDLYAESPWTYEFMLQVSRTKDSGDARQFHNPLYITRLIPIRVRTGNEQKDVILWYHPQTSVLAALPHRVQVQLRDEVKSIEAGIPSSDTALATYRTWISCTRYELDSILAATRPTATLNIDKEDPAATGSCYLSFCTITSGGINSAPIFPNPAHDAVTIGYRLMGRRMVTITLHDINGAPVRQLVAPHLKEAGRWEMRGSLAGVKPGIYLVVISTQNGEQVVQRVIVE